MARSVRVEFEGAWYHVMARGNRRHRIFETEQDCEMMLETLGEASGKSGWEVHAWVLLNNHFHFVIHTPQANLVEGMRWFMNTYTRRFNSRNRLWGRVFGDRYKSLLIEAPEHSGQGDYLRSVLWYVHLNPVRAGLVRRDEHGRWKWGQYRWSSLVREYAVSAGKRHNWSRVGTGLDLEHLSDTAAGRRAYLRLAGERVEEWRRTKRRRKGKEVLEQEQKAVGQGWYVGGEGFRDWLIDLLEQRGDVPESRDYRESRQGHDHGLVRAERIIQQAEAFFGVGSGEWKRMKGAEVRRLALAEAIWRQTNVRQSWIAERLGMRSAANVSQQLRLCRERLPGLVGRRKWKNWSKVLKMDG